MFEIAKTASGYGALTTLATFSGANGASPQGDLISDAAGDLFGTTAFGGANGDGTVFEIVKATGALTTLLTFSGANGDFPYGSLISDAAGDLIGTTAFGGADGDGTVFELPYALLTIDSATVVVDSDPAVAPTITGTEAGQTTTSEAPLDSFSTVTIADMNNGGGNSDSLSITFAAADGSLSGAGLTGSNGSYSLTGTAATITGELRALAFTPVDRVPNTSVTTTFTLSAADSTAKATSASNNTATVIDSDPAVAPTITGALAGQTTTWETPLKPFSSVTFGDLNNGGTNSDSLTITLAGGGTLTWRWLGRGGRRLYAHGHGCRTHERAPRGDVHAGRRRAQQLRHHGFHAQPDGQRGRQERQQRHDQRRRQRSDRDRCAD